MARVLAAVRRSPAHADRMHVAAFLLPRLPRWFLCSDTLKTERPSSNRRSLERGWDAKWVSFNTRSHVNAITIDVDHSNWREEIRALSDQDIPDPTWVTWNPESDHAQVTWLLPIGARRDNQAQMRLLDGVRDRLTTDMNGDTQFKNRLLRNPLHPDNVLLWFAPETHELSALLGPLIAWAEPGTHVLPPRVRPRPAFEAQMRGQEPGIPAVPSGKAEALGKKGARLWEVGTQRVYRARTADPARITGILEDTAAELGSPIKPRALAGMARRIAAWMGNQEWANGQAVTLREGINHGIMTDEAVARGEGRKWREMPLVQKLPLAAARTNAKRAESTTDAIARGLGKLAAERRDVTQAALADAAGLSLRTIAKAWMRPAPANCQLYALRSYPFYPLAAAQRSHAEGGLRGEKQSSVPDGNGFPNSPDEAGHPSLWDVAVAITTRSRERRAARAKEDAAILQWNQQAARMKKAGGLPEAVRRPDEMGIPDPSRMAQAAHAVAVEAALDAERRKAARSQAADRKAMEAAIWSLMLAMARAGDEKAAREIIRRRPLAWGKAVLRHGIEGLANRFKEALAAYPRARLARTWQDAKQAVKLGVDERPPRSRKAAIPFDSFGNLDLMLLAMPWRCPDLPTEDVVTVSFGSGVALFPCPLPDPSDFAGMVEEMGLSILSP